MKKVLTVVSRVSKTQVKAIDSSGRKVMIDTPDDGWLGKTVLVVNGIIVTTVRKRTPVIYQV